jgi:DNA-binding beta-propeller fold protein YncE
MGTAQNFAVLGASTVTNTGSTVLTGDLGVSPGTSITGFPPGTVVGGTIDSADAVATQAQSDVATAYANLSSQACTATYGVPTDIGGQTLAPGVYCFTTSVQLTGTLTLNGGGDPNAVWIFKSGTTLITASKASVVLTNGAQQCKVFWQVGSSATIGAGSSFIGTILASASITLGTDATVAGRALAENGAVTMDSDTVSFLPCNHACYEVTSRVTRTIVVAPTVADANGVPVRGTAFGATLSPDATSVWVTGYNGTTNPGFVKLIDVESHAVGSSLAVGVGPADIVFSNPGGRAWISNIYSSTLTQVDVPTLQAQYTLPMGTAGPAYPFGVAYSKGHLLVSSLATDNQVPELDSTNPPTLRKAISVAGQSGRPAVVPAKASIYADKMLVPVFAANAVPGTGHPTLAIVDLAKATIVATVSLAGSGAVPEAVVVGPDGRYAYVSLYDSSGGKGGVWVVDLHTLKTKTIIQTGDTANFGEAMSTDGTYLLVAGYLKSQVALIYTASNQVDNIIQGGEQPNSIVLNKENSEAYVTNQTDGTVSVISFSPKL